MTTLKIAADLSLISTALAWGGNDIPTGYVIIMKPGAKLSKHHKKVAELVNCHYLQYDGDLNQLVISESTRTNFPAFQNWLQTGIDFLKQQIDIDNVQQVVMEGYSYDNTGNKVLQQVQLGALFQNWWLNNNPQIDFHMLTPKELKIGAARLTYGEKEIKNKKGTNNSKWVINPNNMGIKGGNFKKHEMLQAILDEDIKDHALKNYLLDQIEILQLKNIPKPVDDLADVYWLYRNLTNLK